MSGSAPPPEDRFLSGFAEAMALSLALKAGLIDRLALGEMEVAALAQSVGGDVEGLMLLLGLLDGGGVTATADGRTSLTPAFRAALPRRTALEAKLAFLRLAAHDTADHLAEMLFDPGGYVGEGLVFELFRYDRAVEMTPENLRLTRSWVDYTTALTEHEAPLLEPHLPLGDVRRLMDVGGNSGAFVRALCARDAGLSATVFDLPVVCEIGRQYVAATPEAPRIAFHPGDARRDVWPADHDAISFKSVLHDWPEPDALDFIRRAHAALPQGGRLLVVERGRFTPTAGTMPFAALGNLVFSRFYRDPEVYLAALRDLGFADVQMQTVEIEMPFHIVSGIKV